MPLIKKEASVVIVLNKDNQVLVLKRSLDAPSYPGYWNFPGGGVDEGEKPKEAAVRELMEEASLKVNPSDLIYFKTSDLPNLIIHYFLTSDYNGKVKINEESTEYKWINIDSLSELGMIPMSPKMIDDIHYYIGVLYDT